MWFVHRIVKILKKHPHILPVVECILKSGKEQKTVTGWLPCHHSNVGYQLTLIPTTDGAYNIASIENMTCTRKKSKRPKFRKQPATYCAMADAALDNVQLWTIAVMYPYWSIVHMDINTVFQQLVNNIEHVCRRGQPHAIHMYNTVLATQSIEAGLRQMGELPYNDWVGFEARMAWQLQTRYNTAAIQEPSKHIDHLQFYNNVWTTTQEIETIRTITTAMTPNNTNIILGSLSPTVIPVRSCIVVRNAEDAYRVHCHLDWRHADIFMLDIGRYSYHELANLGIVTVQTLPARAKHVFVAWSHLWGLDQWLQLIAKTPMSYTCVGRNDQYTVGRGQLFRDLCESKQFETTLTTHCATRNVVMVQTDSIADYVAQVVQQHKSVQCFADAPIGQELDTKRRQLSNPTRIRTLRDRHEAPTIKPPRLPLMEEPYTTEDCAKLNKSVVDIRSFNGVHVHAAVYICSKDTTPFQIHVAQTHAREALYVVNCQTCLFSLRKISPTKITIPLSRCW